MLIGNKTSECTWLKVTDIGFLFFFFNLEENLCLSKNKHPKLQLESLCND